MAEPMMLARSEERDCYSVDAGTFHFEWCAMPISETDRDLLPLDERFSAIAGVYRRRIDTPERTDEEGQRWRQWALYGHGPTVADAIEMMGDGSWYTAESLAPEHRAHVERYRRAVKRNEAMGLLRDFYHRKMREQQEAKDKAQKTFTTALKRSKLFKACETNSADPVKVAAIRERVRAEYGPQISRAIDAALACRAKLEQRGFNV